MGDGIRCVNDLKVYRLAYQLAMEIFEITKRQYDQVNAMLFSLMNGWEEREPKSEY